MGQFGLSISLTIYFLMYNFWKKERLTLLNGRYIKVFGQKNERKMAKKGQKKAVLGQKMSIKVVSKIKLYALYISRSSESAL